MIYIFILSIIAIAEFFISGFCIDAGLNDIRILSLLGLAQYIISLVSWKSYRQEVLSPYIILLTAIYIFQCGQALLFALPIDYTPKLFGYMGITYNAFFLALAYTLILLVVFHVGALMYVKHNVLNRIDTFDNMSVLKSNKALAVIRNVALAFFLVSFLPYYFTVVDKAVRSMTIGYGALYSEENAVGFGHLMESIGDYYIPSYICLLIGCKNKRLIRYLLLIIGFITCGLILMTGSRTNAVLILSVIIIFQNYFVKRFNKKQIVLTLVSALVLLNVMAVVKGVRSADNKDISTFLIYESEDNPAVKAIEEMGGSMFCTIKMMEIIPSEDDWFYGKSYLYSLFSLIPNLGFWDHHPSRDYGMTDIWLTERLGLNYGSGSSMAAEVYLNFGYLGFIVFFLYGYIAANFFSRLTGDIRNNRYIQASLVMMVFWFCLYFPRYPFMTTFRGIIFYAIPIYWLTRYFYNRYSRKLK